MPPLLPPSLRGDAPLLLACSPRPGGNCDTAARLFAGGFAGNAGGAFASQPLSPVFLRDRAVLPCVSCSSCFRAVARNAAGRVEDPAQSALGNGLPGKERGRKAGEALSASDAAAAGAEPAQPAAFGCPLTLKDDSAALLRSLCRAPALYLVSPIYFYHLPAQFKALIDRLQPFWAMKEAGDPALAALPERLCHAILIAGRPRGEKLFEGSLLTLKTALGALRVRLAPPLLLRGLDGPADLRNNPELAEQVAEYGRQAASLIS